MSEPTNGGPGLPQQRKIVTEIPGPKSRALQERRLKAVPPGVGSTLPVYTVAAGGGVLVDVDGNSLIDFGSGIAVTNVGNAHPEVVRRVQQQVAAFTHTCFMVTPYEPYVEVCERLNALTPGDHEKRTILVNSGAEAVENAVKIARYATKRPAIVVFDHGYHGRTLLTMTLTAKNMPYKEGFGPYAPEVYRVPMAYPYRSTEDGPATAAKVIDQISKQIGAHNVAAVLVEPILGEGGFIEPSPGFLPAIAEFAEDNGILFIADEIQTGFGRTGRLFACEHEGIVPDLITTAKGIAGGLPLAAVTGRAEVMDAVHGGGLGGTYGGNPLACEAALAVFDALDADRITAKAARIGEIMLPALRELAAGDPRIGDVRGRGAMIAIELVKPGTDEPDAALAGAIAKACHAQGLIVLTAGTYGNVLRFLPPLVIPEDLLHEGLDLLAGAIAETR
ncbi:4-aminobutyrate aminotransferase/(S)-3-amino-2-methylpropionate transaminase [Actinocorallia herbida]|uniref:(S)-3-amino-2-methylpropionate transaminase n=1 Tax=Actinocorallia herbida TaxID=58109 RepID=A0A3N1CQI2_9ACTN|nr:4-aminobutyrate--2-oxoglutarate transaminase [Actinocorallia herbida]ROO83455.1 4-aminobutyrate aminotransferase/(S)-3-amino-2-methylpropionate transaminase [Actinocorallia herbida]